MRLVTIDDGGPGSRRAGLLTPRGIVDLSRSWPAGPRSVMGILCDGCLEELSQLKASELPAAAFLPAATPLWAPVDRPGKILALGLNFKSHAEENKKPLPEIPIVFSKATTALNSPTGDIVIPPGTRQVDWEVELCLVVGRQARGVSPNQAMDYVAGFTVMNDVSARDWQYAVSQWHRAKSADTFAPMGPALVTLDEAAPQWGPSLRDGWPRLRLLCRVNGETLQDCIAGDDMIFSPAEVLSFVSRSETLEVGDCISLGTPAGVGYYRRPQRFLKAGDVVECEIPGLGGLRNRVVAG